ncbi:hypothetical protein [Photobacterium sanguinicancri]|uniref:Uncharacterized protein n=1 Tax=Photobacterium sanguinicancri TaxID=875932 RepID=A0AAW7Y3A7_9GAMM|nr:hypothetical protein [Photobacterium sanguinicancri]KXI21185.1 hypothetical protein AS132_21245 [Photobacterium sanguinicancri]MDO6498354.1 hypothetical protein [Photobacterium sanguinicancri]MDO6541442.1 hypothetical protein [Photobacterium sanguinicancri]OZS42864.1 hypothetical protein ASV53_16230 [Photobacterium sanguinicancri]
MSLIRIPSRAVELLSTPPYLPFKDEMLTLEPTGFVARLIKETASADELGKLGLRVRVIQVGKACLAIESVVPVDLSVEYQLSLFRLGQLDGMVTELLTKQSGLYHYLFKTNKMFNEGQLSHFY